MFFFRVVPLYFLLVVNVLGYTAPYYDLENSEQYFVDFIKKYEKKYDSSEEYNKRFEIFKANLERINNWNNHNKHENGGYAVTRFSDQVGHKSCLDAKPRNTTNILEVKGEFIVNAPNHIDYREQNLVTEVKNQLSCGSCYVFAAIGNIEGMHAKATGNLVSLSEQQGLDCEPTGNCETGGQSINVMNALASQGGSMSEQDYPYMNQKGTCHTDQSRIMARVLGGNSIPTPDIETLKGALYQNGAPLAGGLYVSPEFTHAQGFVIVNPTDCNYQKPNHAILVVGYSTDPTSGRSYWIIKNSWGTDNGDNGYYYLDMDSSTKCSFLTMGVSTSNVQ